MSLLYCHWRLWPLTEDWAALQGDWDQRPRPAQPGIRTPRLATALYISEYKRAATVKFTSSEPIKIISLHPYTECLDKCVKSHYRNSSILMLPVIATWPWIFAAPGLLCTRHCLGPRVLEAGPLPRPMGGCHYTLRYTDTSSNTSPALSLTPFSNLQDLALLVIFTERLLCPRKPWHFIPKYDIKPVRLHNANKCQFLKLKVNLVESIT